MTCMQKFRLLIMMNVQDTKQNPPLPAALCAMYILARIVVAIPLSESYNQGQSCHLAENDLVTTDGTACIIASNKPSPTI